MVINKQHTSVEQLLVDGSVASKNASVPTQQSLLRPYAY
jgi:hypothetical protein